MPFIPIKHAPSSRVGGKRPASAASVDPEKQKEQDAQERFAQNWLTQNPGRMNARGQVVPWTPEERAGHLERLQSSYANSGLNPKAAPGTNGEAIPTAGGRMAFPVGSRIHDADGGRSGLTTGGLNDSASKVGVNSTEPPKTLQAAVTARGYDVGGTHIGAPSATSTPAPSSPGVNASRGGALNSTGLSTGGLNTGGLKTGGLNTGNLSAATPAPAPAAPTQTPAASAVAAPAATPAPAPGAAGAVGMGGMGDLKAAERQMDATPTPSAQAFPVATPTPTAQLLAASRSNAQQGGATSATPGGYGKVSQYQVGSNGQTALPAGASASVPDLNDGKAPGIYRDGQMVQNGDSAAPSSLPVATNPASGKPGGSVPVPGLKEEDEDNPKGSGYAGPKVQMR